MALALLKRYTGISRIIKVFTIFIMYTQHENLSVYIICCYISPTMHFIPGTHHGADVDTVWGYALLDFNEEVQDDCGMLPLENNTQLDYDYAIFVQDLWTNFAKFG